MQEESQETSYDIQKLLCIYEKGGSASEESENQILLLLKTVKTDFNHLHSESGWGLIHYAAYFDHTKILNFLLQVKDIKADLVNLEKNSALHLLVKNIDCLKWFLSKNLCDKELLGIKNIDGKTAIHLAIKENQLEAVNILIFFFKSIYRDLAQFKLIDEINDGVDEKILECLKKNEVVLPYSFVWEEKYGHQAFFLKWKEEIEQLCTFAEKGNIQEIENLLKTSGISLNSYNSQGCLIIGCAISAKQIKTYQYLLSLGVRVYPESGISNLLVLTNMKKEFLHDLKFFNKDEETIKEIFNCTISINSSNHNTPCYAIYNKLYGNDSIALYNAYYNKKYLLPILKILSYIENLKIYYDPGSKNTAHVEESSSVGTRGVTSFKKREIYLTGDHEENKILGTAIHEFTHMICEFIWGNDYNPYLNKKPSETYLKIVSNIREKYQSNKLDTSDNKIRYDDILSHVFEMYENEKHHPSELIVRVPHIIAERGAYEGIKILQKQAPELLEFYENYFLKECQIFIENHEKKHEENLTKNNKRILKSEILDKEIEEASKESKPFLFIKKGEMLFEIEEYEAALEAFKEAEKFDTDDSVKLYIEFYISQIENLKFNEADKNTGIELSITSNDPEVRLFSYYLKAQALFNSGKYLSAIAMLNLVNVKEDILNLSSEKYNGIKASILLIKGDSNLKLERIIAALGCYSEAKKIECDFSISEKINEKYNEAAQVLGASYLPEKQTISNSNPHIAPQSDKPNISKKTSSSCEPITRTTSEKEQELKIKEQELKEREEKVKMKEQELEEREKKLKLKEQESELMLNKKEKTSLTQYGMFVPKIDVPKCEKDELIRKLREKIFNYMVKINISLNKDGLTIQLLDSNTIGKETVEKFFSNLSENYKSSQYDSSIFIISNHEEIKEFVNIYLEGNFDLLCKQENLNVNDIDQKMENCCIM